MAIGRNFQESLQKAIRGLEIGVYGLESKIDFSNPLIDEEQLKNRFHHELQVAGADRLWYIADAFRYGYSLATVQTLTKIDPWFLAQIEALVKTENSLQGLKLQDISLERLRNLKRQGFSDRRLSQLFLIDEKTVRDFRHQHDLHPVYKRVDTCAAEFATETAYFYSTYEEENECTPSQKEKIVVLGGGPNRIGQGIEFDYCCVHAAFAMRELGYETIMVNCNPETVSTDYDISDRLYFEPLTLEDVLEIVVIEKPKGVIIQYGGQTPLKLARQLEKAGVPIIGTSPDAIDCAEDRERFQRLINTLGLKQPRNGTVRSREEGQRLAKVFAYPIIVRPSYVLGGRAMRVIFNENELIHYLDDVKEVSPEAPLLLDQFLEDAIEVDVDAVCDGKTVFIGGILEHIEQAGIHSGDSSCTFPPHSLSEEIQQQLKEQMRVMAKKLGVIGLINAQFAIKNNEIYVLEVNPRASRTVPFIAKATGLSLAKIAAKCMVGISLQQQNIYEECIPDYFAVKNAVFPFTKFPGADPILGPEMRSTGEVMGIGNTFGEAFAKGQQSTGQTLPKEGKAFISVRDADKVRVVNVAKQLQKAGFSIVATRGTARCLIAHGVNCEVVNKVTEGRPHIVDLIKNQGIQFIINTSEGEQSIADSFTIRQSAVSRKVCYTTTLAGGEAACLAMQHRYLGEVNSLQSLYRRLKKRILQ